MTGGAPSEGEVPGYRFATDLRVLYRFGTGMKREETRQNATICESHDFR